ncbi:FAD-binding domain-containing protein [Ophiobolus disseminans]|uniref:FAD-binding domain-containing protein n=1 Tax=Ophiobolus disseminans TaxID=1469910 RepID=A0A6A7A0D6_9PLEO|nr:FAD-binding domain-containing protein [Ophiobolus disseminans]
MNAEDALKEALPHSILERGGQDYDEANGSYFTLFASNLKPAFIVQPSDANEVSKILRAISPHWKENSTRVAVRGTGHTPFAGSANIADGITIDLRKLKGIELSEADSTVCIGVGEMWGSVYDALEKHGLTTAGGRVDRVGVGGLVLGGGMSIYSTRHGFVCDSIIDFEIVLASGKIIHANAHDHSNLWTALKGGLNNFGVVTSVKMRTFESRSIWGGVAYYMPNAFEELVEATVDFVHHENDEDTHIITSAGYGFGHNIATCCMYQTQGVEKSPSMQRFTSVPGMIESHSNLRTSTHVEFCKELSDFTKDNVRSFYATLTIHADAPLVMAIHHVWAEVLAGLKDAEGFIFSLGLFPLTKALLHNARKAGGNAQDIDPEDGPLLIVFLNPTWDSDSDDLRINEAVERLLEKSKAIARDTGKLHRYIFPNYAFHKEDVFQGYGDRALSALRETSKEFDPEGFFQHVVPGGFKLGMSG